MSEDHAFPDPAVADPYRKFPGAGHERDQHRDSGRNDVGAVGRETRHPPALIETLVSHWLDDGYDVVFTAKAHRANESLFRRIAVKCFYAIMNWRARAKIPEDAGDFRLLSPRAAEALRQLPERNRFFKGLATWIGFRQLRVRFHDAVARVEIEAAELPRAFELRDAIVAAGKTAGFTYVTLDLEGFRSGAMNEPLIALRRSP